MVILPVIDFIKCLFLFCTVPIQWWRWSGRVAEITDENFVELYLKICHLASYWGRLSCIPLECFHSFCANICSVHITRDWFQLSALVTCFREFLHLKKNVCCSGGERSNPILAFQDFVTSSVIMMWILACLLSDLLENGMLLFCSLLPSKVLVNFSKIILSVHQHSTKWSSVNKVSSCTGKRKQPLGFHLMRVLL